MQRFSNSFLIVKKRQTYFAGIANCANFALLMDCYVGILRTFRRGHAWYANFWIYE